MITSFQKLINYNQSLNLSTFLHLFCRSRFCHASWHHSAEAGRYQGAASEVWHSLYCHQRGDCQIGGRGMMDKSGLLILFS